MVEGISIKRFIPGILWFILVLALICLPKSDIPSLHGWFHGIYGDKWVHAILFGILAWLFLRPFQTSSEISKERKQRICLRIVLLTIAWGYATECIQRFVPGRSYDLMDWAADSVGVALAFLINVKFKSKNSKVKIQA